MIYRCSTSHPRRRGVAILEGSIVISVLLFFFFVVIDLGLALFRTSVLSEAAVQLARQASVRGKGMASDVTPWGPTAYMGNASMIGPIPGSISSKLQTMNLSEVTISMTWTDGTNEEGDHVNVVLTYSYQPILNLFNASTVSLRGQATVAIVN